MTLRSPHEFHIPVMGTAFTIDTPLKVAKFGISSVVSIGDDELCETMRKYHAGLNHKPYTPIKKYDDDYRARRIQEYLDLMQEIINDQIEDLVKESFDEGTDLRKYFELLSEESPLKKAFNTMLALPEGSEKVASQKALRKHVVPGRIDVNIMTKIDRLNYTATGELLPEEFSDALSALRGFAQSSLRSGIVFSAGFNRRLYAYVAKFDCFFPDEKGDIEKKIILKVSDFRSAYTQSKFFAKKGVFVSEQRIESGLNCGGHAFATDGFLMGPILQEFKDRKKELTTMMVSTCNEQLKKEERPLFQAEPDMLVTVQGGIGTANEHRFLLDHFDADSTGWATPFLLSPEVTNLDDATRDILVKAQKKDLYLSDVSPLGVPFNTVRGTASEKQKLERVANGRPGSPCPKAHLVSNTEFTKKPICTASVLYQRRKIEELNKKELPKAEYDIQFNKIIAKACLCEDLAAGALISGHIDNKRPLTPTVCSGPNMAYFDRLCTLSDMVGHIYGRLNVMANVPRSNMFVSELKMYIDYLRKQILEALPSLTEKRIDYFRDFRSNLIDGIRFYEKMIPSLKQETAAYRDAMAEELGQLLRELDLAVQPLEASVQPG